MPEGASQFRRSFFYWEVVNGFERGSEARLSCCCAADPVPAFKLLPFFEQRFCSAPVERRRESRRFRIAGKSRSFGKKRAFPSRMKPSVFFPWAITLRFLRHPGQHPTDPKKHGPYGKLSYVHRGKKVCRFVRADSAEEMKTRLATYKEFRELTDRWIQLSIECAKIEFFTTSKKRPSELICTLTITLFINLFGNNVVGEVVST